MYSDSDTEEDVTLPSLKRCKNQPGKFEFTMPFIPPPSKPVEPFTAISAVPFTATPDVPFTPVVSAAPFVPTIPATPSVPAAMPTTPVPAAMPTVESFFDDLSVADDEHRDILSKVNDLYLDELQDIVGELRSPHADVDLIAMQEALHIMTIIKGVRKGQRYQPIESGRWWKNIVVGTVSVLAYMYM